MCEFFGISRAAFYLWKKRDDDPGNDERKTQILEAYIIAKKRYGYRRICIWLRKHKGIVINHKAILRLMNEMGICSIARKRLPWNEKTAIESAHCYDNVLHREFSATKPNQKWTTDITFIPTTKGWVYLSAIKDLHDNFIVAHKISKKKDTHLVNETIKMACINEKVTDGLILHSDQGTQYSSHSYYSLIQQYNIIPSMSRRGNCWDNAPIENFFGHLKEELIRHIRIRDIEEAKELIDEYIHFFNYERIQLKTKQTPYEIRCLSV